MSRSASFTALDWIAVGLSALLSLALIAFPFTVGPLFAGMLSEFGGTLPAVTRVALTPWAAPSLGLFAASPVIVAVALPEAGSLGLRRAMVLLGFFLGLFALGAAVFALYAPIFDLAGKIKAE
jgi:hypothetical protein